MKVLASAALYATADSAGTGAELRRSRRPGRFAGRHRSDSGDGNRQAAAEYRNTACRAVCSTYDALEMTFRQFKIRRDPDCAACGPNAHIDLASIPEFVCAVQTDARIEGEGQLQSTSAILSTADRSTIETSSSSPKNWGWSSKSNAITSRFSIRTTNAAGCRARPCARSARSIDYAAFLEKLHYLIKKVHAHECELVSDSGTHRLSLRIDKIDDETVDDLRQFLGREFISLAVVPEGMAFMQLELQFQVIRGQLPKSPNSIATVNCSVDSTCVRL